MTKNLVFRISMILLFLGLTICSFFVIPEKSVKAYEAVENSSRSYTILDYYNMIDSYDDYSCDYDDSILPSEYCMRDEYMLYVEQQASQGLCWDFTASMSLSTTIMKSTGAFLNFSEGWISTAKCYTIDNDDALKFVLGNYYPGDGGWFFGFDIIAKTQGLVLEQDFPFEESFYNSAENNEEYFEYYSQFANFNIMKNVESGMFNDYVDQEDGVKSETINSIKQHILNHGSVYAGMRWGGVQEFSVNDLIYSYKSPSTDSSSGHAVSLVGWDDDFKVTYNDQTYEGAWIALNSWGNNNDTAGMLYILYDDIDFDSLYGYKYKEDTTESLFLNISNVDSNAEYVTDLAGVYYGDCTSFESTTNQKNIFYNIDDVSLEYTYNISQNTKIDNIVVYNGSTDVTKNFFITHDINKIYINGNNLDVGSYKVEINYSNETDIEQIITSFYICDGLEINFAYYYFYDYNEINTNGNYQTFNNFNYVDNNLIVASNVKTGWLEIQLIFSSYNEIVSLSSFDTSIVFENINHEACWLEINYDLNKSTTYLININSSNKSSVFKVTILPMDISSEWVTMVYDLNGGVNNTENLKREIVSATVDTVIANPTREGYAFAGWYYSKDLSEESKLTKDGEIYYLEYSKVYSTTVYKGWQTTYTSSYNKLSVVFLHAKWVDSIYTITSHCEGNGSISPEGIVTKKYLENQTYTFTADYGYHVSSIKIDGVILSDLELEYAIDYGYTFYDIGNDHSIIVEFKANVWEIICNLNYDSRQILLNYDYNDDIDSIYIPEREHYTFVGWYIDEELQSPFDVEKMPNNNLNIYAKWNVNSYTIQAEASENGTISPQGNISIEYLSSQMFMFTANYGYHVESIAVDGVNLQNEEFEDALVNGYTFSNIDKNHTIYVEFAVNKYNIILDFNYEGKSDQILKFAYLENIDLPVDWIRNFYTFAGWYNEEECLTEFNLDTMPAEDVIVFALWRPNSYNIKATCSENGSIFPFGDITKTYLENQTYTFVANYGYHVSSIKIDNKTLSNSQLDHAVKNGYTFLDISKDHTIEVQFSINAYNITFDLGFDNVTSTTTLKYGDEIPYIEVPVREYYTFAGWYEKTTGEVFNYVRMPMVNCSVVARWLPNSYTITVVKNGGGDIYPSQNQTKSYQEDQIFTFSADEGYLISDILIDGVGLDQENINNAILYGYKFLNINQNHSIEVKFTKKVLKIDIVVGDGGNFSADKSLDHIDYGEDCTINFDLDFNKKIDAVYINNQKIKIEGNTLKLNNVTKDLNISVIFKDANVLLTPNVLIMISIALICVIAGTITIVVIVLKRR